MDIRRIADMAAVAVLFVLGLIALATYRDYGLGWDDFTHAQMGDLVVAMLRSGFSDTRALSFVNLYMYGSGFDVAAALLDRALPTDLFETRRLLGAGIGIAGIAITWRIARRIGGPLAGVAAVMLLAATPLYYGHMYMNPKDAPFAVASILLLLAMVRTFEEYPSPTPRTVMLFGIALGCTLGTRIIGGLSAIYAALALLPLLHRDWQEFGGKAAARRFGSYVLALVPGLLVGYLVMGLIWPWSVTSPLNPLHAITYFSHFFEKPWKELYEGVAISVPQMPWTYLPRLFFLKLPEILSVTAVIGCAIALWRIFDPKLSVRERAALTAVVGAIAVPLLVTVITRPALYNGVRHFIFLLPPMAVLGGIAAATIAERLSQHRRLLTVGGAAFALGIASPAIEMVRLHPYQYAHFNRIAGGIRGADASYMLDYWGLAFKQAAQGLRAKLTEEVQTPPAGRRWKIAVCGPHPPAAVELGPEFDLTWDPRGADFALMLGEFYCRDLSAPVLAEVAREGVVFARAYDIRGRTVTSLFTVAPP